MGEALGRGGTAVVYRGLDQVLRVPRAIKVLDAGWTTHRTQLRKRLRDEARAMSLVRHPNVLTVYDVVESGEFDFVVMDIAEGGSLSARIERTGPLPAAEAAGLLVQVLGALSVAHANGVIHRDVKPQNILLDGEGSPLLADFGIALLNMEEATRSTRTGVAMGSVAYMAPEQRMDARSVGAAADVYACGATLFYLLTGANPVDLFMVGFDSERVRDVPAPLRRVVVTATRYEPDRRYPSAAAMAADLERAVEELSAPPEVVTEPPVAPETVSRWRPARWVGGAMVLAVLVGVVTWGGGRTDVPPPAPPPMVTEATPSPTVPDDDSPVDPVPVAPAAIVAELSPSRGSPVLSAPRTTTAVRTPPENTTPTVAAEPPFGAWRGSINGLVTTFTLAGTAERVTGTVTTSRAGASLSFAVEGSFDGATRLLTLRDRFDGPDAGVYMLTLDSTLRRFSGSFVRSADGTRVVVQGFR